MNQASGPDFFCLSDEVTSWCWRPRADV